MRGASRRVRTSARAAIWAADVYKRQEQGFDWWVARIRRTLALYDSIRLDHFRGFEAYWSIAADEPLSLIHI